ncbi:MAG: HNH endonuclease [Terracidiphilus sp.]
MRHAIREEIPQPEDTSIRHIPLTRGQFAIVDADDYPELMKYKWNALWHPRAKSWVARTTPSGGSIPMHRLVLKAPKGVAVDHINHNCIDNRKSNLRLATAAQNMANRRRMSSNTSGYIGVTTIKYRAFIQGAGPDGKRRHTHLGYFDSAEEAARARDREVLRIYGDFAHLNFPRSDYI